MSTARNYLAREIYRSTLVVMLALMGLFSFFTLVDQLDTVNDRFPLSALFFIEALALPTKATWLCPSSHRLPSATKALFRGSTYPAVPQPIRPWCLATGQRSGSRSGQTWFAWTRVVFGVVI